MVGSQQEYMNNMMVAAGMRGTVFWVDAINGSASNDGLSSDRPKATIAQAIALSNTDIALPANLNKNNTIFIRGDEYSGDITTPALYCDLIGLDINRSGWRPRINGAIIVEDAKGMRLFNLQLTNTGAEPTVVITGASHNFELNNCEIRWATGTTYGFHLNGDSYYVKIKNCRFTADHATAIRIDQKCKALEIIDNWINASACGIYVKAGAASDTSFDSIIKGNVITRSDPNQNDALAIGIDMAVTDSVPNIMIIGNWIAADDAIHFGINPDDDYDWIELSCIDNHIVQGSSGGKQTSGS